LTQHAPTSGRECVDILIVGGGIAGMVAAAAFGSSGFKTLMVDPATPVIEGHQAGSDLRSTAFLRPARDLFRKIGIWDALAPHATPLDGLRIVDTLATNGDAPIVRSQRQFEGRETADEPFGWNFLNWRMRQALVEILPSIPKTETRFGIGFKSILTRTGSAIVTLTDGRQVEAKLVIAADGRGSAVRTACGIDTSITRYGQKSLAFTAYHTLPHGNVSTEIYRDGGPFTMVPLRDIDGRHASAIVWMNKGPKAVELLNMAPEPFNAEMTDRAAGLLGEMELASQRGIFPIITQVADRLSAQRVAIVAEAAHVLPPIGAQGLNTSLNDIAALLALCEVNPTELGTTPMLDSYAQTRHRDIKARAKVVDLFNRVVRSDEQILQSVRLLGLKAVHDFKPLRMSVMRAGLGPL
jgi:2-octaprenyl-6-methoxyphenol hydroxylase